MRALPTRAAAIATRAAAVACLALGMAVAPAAGADPTPAVPRTPIEHAVFLMEESHSFDNIFGTYPGADGIPADVCMPTDPAKPAGTCVAPLWVGDRTVPELGQTRPVFDAQYRDGKMDGFVSAQAGVGKDAALAMGHYDERDVPFSWNVADAYVLFDHFFSSARGGSVWNHMFWVAGAAGSETDAIPANGFGDLPTIFDRLQAAGISWKFYVQNYDPTITYRNAQGMIDRASQVERAPLLAFGRFLDDPRLFGRIADLSEYYTDLEQGTLPAVSYIVPAGGGAHTTASVRAAEQLGGSVINALTRSTAWPTSMLLWTYSGWGGWYDHVAPPQPDAYGYGFRVPAVLVSPYARKGFVDPTQLDYASIVRFITDNWGLRSLAARDASAETFMGAFDFANPGRPPTFVSSTREVGAAHREPQRAIIFVTYGLALAGALALIGVAVRRSRRPRGPATDAKEAPP